MKLKSSKYFLDILFWIALLFYLDPAGWFRLSFSDGRFTQVYFFIITISIFLIQIVGQKDSLMNVLNDYWIKKYSRFLVFFLLYWLIIHCWLNTPLHQGSSIMPIFRTRRVIMEVFLVYPIYYFTIRNSILFLRLFYISTIAILGLYFLSILTPLDVVKINSFNRGYTEASRNLLFGYGLLPFGTFIGVVAFFIPIKKRNKIINRLILAGVLVVIMWVVTIVRRELVGVIITTIITMFLFHKLFKRNYGLIIRRALTYAFIIVLLLFFTFPRYITAVGDSFGTIYNSVFNKKESNETDTRRVSLTANTFIINKIIEYPVFGTGYYQKWYIGAGDDEGYEGSDYIFLATLAQHGIVGLFFFLGFYVLVFRIIRKYFEILARNRRMIMKNMNVFYPYIIIFLAMAVFYFRHLISFPNWFYPIAAIADSPKFFMALGFMMGAGKMITSNLTYLMRNIDNKSII